YGPGVDEEVLEVKGNVTVSVEDVTLKNMVIDGDLYLAEGIGEGDVTLDNITVLGETIVKGGGENSIIIKNSSLTNLLIIKKDGKIRIVAQGSTTTGKTYLNSSVKLQGEKSNKNSFGEVEIIRVTPGEKIEFEGSFSKIDVKAAAEIELTEGSSVDELNIEKQSEGTKVSLGEKSKITTLNTSAAKTTVSGDGDVETINANEGSDDSIFTVPDAKVVSDASVKVNETEVKSGEEVVINDTGTDIVRVEEEKTTTTITRYSVNYNVIGSGGTLETTISSGDRVRKGTELTFTATPDTGYEIKEWEVNDITTTVSGITLTKTINSNTSVTVEFELIEVPINQYTVTYEVIGEGGTLDVEVESGTLVDEATELTFTAIPLSGYEVKEWTYNGVTVFPDGDTLGAGVGDDLHITVEFKPIVYTINYSVIGGNGSITASSTSYASVTDGMDVNRGTSITFTSVPDEGYKVKDWKLNGESMGPSLSIALTFISEDTDVTIEFEEIPIAIQPLRITVTPSDATVTVTDSSDNVMTGTFTAGNSQWTYDLPVGLYDIKIEKAGYNTYTDTQNMIGPSSHMITLEEMSDNLGNINLKGGTYDENITINGFEFTPTTYEYSGVIIPYNFTTAGSSDYFDIYVEENTTDGNSTLQINGTTVSINSYGRIYINPGETKTIEIIYTQTGKAPKIYTIEITRSTDVELLNIAGETSVLYNTDRHGFLVEKETITKEDIVVTEGATVTFYENIFPYNIEVSNQTVVNNPGLYDEFWIEILGADGITSKKYLVGITRKIEFLEISSEWTQSVLSVSLKYSGPLDSSKTPDANQFSILINNQETIAYYAQGNDNILKVQFNNPAGSTTESAIGIFKYLPNDLNPVKDSLGNTPKEHGLLNVSIEGKPISIVSASAERVDFSGDSIDDLKIEITYDGSLMQDTSSVIKGYITIDLTSREEDPSPSIVMSESNKLYLIYNNFYNNIYGYTNISKELKYTSGFNLEDINGKNVKVPDSIIIFIPE
ncbi:MAG: hypothetical protein SCJ93_12535, partial [Bacillota bacterium]|nr:hypothetical protein [Bacillota bacterium]